MEPGQYQMQIFVSLVVVLGAAFVALICDFLKGNNEQLRELTVELKVRNEEERRRSQLLVPQPVAAPSVKMETPEAERKIETRAPRAVAAKEPRRAASPDALAAMERGAQLASSPRPRAAEASTARSNPPAPPEKKSENKTDWDALLSRKARKMEQRIETQPEESVPAGFHNGFILSKLVQKRQPVSGLVVSIGVNGPRDADGSSTDSVKDVIQSLMGPSDFACQSGAEEFLLIYPNEHGASAQRKLSQIAQQLWDFQLRSLGTFSILFSWGGVEVASESIEEAIASANERMQETRRGRKLLTMEPRFDAPLKKAV